ncbi:MAG: hypothetical protein Q8O67_33095, partial [Deltaproteobacteria bacterium]|nr:hypothetical protein [Deltaproteobacteria bacterium]
MPINGTGALSQDDNHAISGHSLSTVMSSSSLHQPTYSMCDICIMLPVDEGSAFIYEEHCADVFFGAAKKALRTCPCSRR